MSTTFSVPNSSRYLGVVPQSERSQRSQAPPSSKKRWGLRSSFLSKPSSRNLGDDTKICVEDNDTHELHRQLQIETAALRKQLGEQVRKGQTLLGLIAKMEQEPTENPSAFLTKMASSLQGESNDITERVFEKADDLRKTADSDGDRSLVETALSRTPWTTCFRGGHVTIGLLSDIYEGIRTIEAGVTKNDKAEVWEAPQTFVRETHKYWVDEKRLGEVMMACAEELPLLVYGQNSGSLYNADEYINPDEDIFERFASKITSIYFDSPDLFLYKERLARSEGANLVRVRWYNEQPKDAQVLFLELKTHHESWVYDKSAKERVEIMERDMHLLLMRDNDAWDMEYAESIAIAAKKDMGDQELAKAAGLLLRIRELIIERDLRPCVRTSYTRIAFQSSKSNALRLTMDRDIRVSDETSAPLGAWFAPDHPGKANALVPCPVFEVKLAGKGMPESVEALILKGAIKNGHKFSKFITGVSVLNAESPHLKTFPYWAAEPIFMKLYAGHDDASVDSARLIGDDPESDGDDVDVETGKAVVPSSPPVRTRGGRIIEFKKAVAPKSRARIEPKSYFAAERTYIQWVSAALLLITVASILDALSAPNTRPTEITMMALAAMITIYALVVYFRRLFLLENAKPYGYQDHMGPVILTGAVFFGIMTILIFSVLADRSGADSTRSISIEPGSCVPRNFTGISMLAFQPSDVIVDPDRDIFIIPSTTDIKGLPKNEMVGTPEVLQSLAFVDQTDLEAVTIGENGILYAVAERPISSELLAFQWLDTKLELVGRWVLNEAANVEGMTYVPSESLGEGESSKLLISADATDPLQSNVLIFDLPTELTMDGTTLFPVNGLNAGLLTAGFDTSSSTRISAMTEFEGDLYILHDNVRTIRGWNLATGELVAELTTPRAGSGFNRQWEGIFLERVGTEIVLHMSLDTPAQIWTFYLEEVTSSAGTSLTFPPCAQAN